MSSLLAERGPIHVHVGATIVVEGKPPAVRASCSSTSTRASALVPRFRQRVTRGAARPRQPGLGRRPALRHRAGTCAARRCRSPGGDGRAARAGRPDHVRAARLRPGRCGSSTWSRGSRASRHAYINKTHHALVDGVAAVDVGTIILDPSPEGTEIEVTDERWEPDEPSPEMLLRPRRLRPDPRRRCGPRARRRARR